MDAFVRGWCFVLTALAACAGASSEPVGVSNRSAGGTHDKSIVDAGADASGLVPADYKASFKKINHARFVSVGHAAGRWDVDVYANDLGARAIETRAKDAPVGAVIVQEHFERSGGSVPGPVMVMEKKAKGFASDHGDWRYASLGASGVPARDTTACAQCHDDAPMDGLFPVLN